LGEAPVLTGMPVVDWLEKPIDHERLLAALRRGVGQPNGEPRRILHVDYDPDVHKIVASLAQGVAEFDYAADVATASRLLRTNCYSLIILDLELPDGSGRDLLPLIAATRPRPRVVVFSASDIPREEAEYFDACLVKSATANDTLLATIKAQTEPLVA